MRNKILHLEILIIIYLVFKILYQSLVRQRLDLLMYNEMWLL